MNEPALPARENTTFADAMINMLYDAAYGEKLSAKKILATFWVHVGVPFMAVFSGTDYKLTYVQFADGYEEPFDVLQAAQLLKTTQLDGTRDLVCVNQLSSLPEAAAPIKTYLENLDVQSFVLIRFTDASGAPSVLFLASISAKRQWNPLHFRYYRLFADVLSKCVMDEAE